MSQSPDALVLGPMDEARRLWSDAREAASSRDPMRLCEALDLGLHAAEILVIHLLQPVKDQFPATIALQLQLPTPEVDPHRDGIDTPKVLQFNDAIDLLSGEDLDCVSPGMHRGWEDRRFSCRRSRVAAQSVIGAALSRDDQKRLLLLSAYRNRVFRYPPPVRIVPGEIRSGFETLERLVEGLLADASDR